jgi:DNA adenine methylase
MKNTKHYQTPLRYPGGKQKDIPFLFKFFKQCQEFREPFLGGGSILLNAVKSGLAATYYANDLNPSVFSFWQEVQNNAEKLADFVWQIHEDHPYSGPNRNSPAWQKFRQHLTSVLDAFPDDQFHNAARFFILNRSTSGGSTESGGMTAAAYCDRFTPSSIARLRNLHGLLDTVQLSNVDYSELIERPGKDVFIFLDPPYLSAEKSGLYGKGGDLHRGFDHKNLAKVLYESPHRWLMTIDDCPEVRELYHWREIHTLAWKKSYGMTNTGGRQSKRGLELLIANFPLNGDIFNLDHFPKSVIQSIRVNTIKPHPIYADIYGELDAHHEGVIYHQNQLKQTPSSQDYPPIDINEHQTIIDGHARHAAYLNQGIAEIPVRIRFCPPAAEKALILHQKRSQDHDGLQKIKAFRVWKNELLEYVDTQIKIHPNYTDITPDDLQNATQTLQRQRIYSRTIAYHFVAASGDDSGRLMGIMHTLDWLNNTGSLKNLKIAKDITIQLQNNTSYTAIEKYLKQIGKHHPQAPDRQQVTLSHDRKTLYALMQLLKI